MLSPAMLRVLARICAAICALLFVFAAVGVVFFQAAGTRFLRAPIYRRALSGQRIYERAPRLAADLAVSALQFRSRAPDSAREALDLAARLTPADWEQLVGAIAPASYLRAQGESALDQLARSFHAETGPISVDVSLVEIKQRLTAGPAEEAFMAVLQRLPPATQQQIQEAGTLPAGSRPPDAMLPQVRAQFREGMRSLAERLPDHFDPFAHGPLPGVGRLMTALADSQDTLLAIERWATWSPALPAVLLLLIALFGVRSLRGLLLWWGIPCLAAGVLAALLALPVVTVARWTYAVLVQPLFPATAPATLIDAIFGVMTAVVQEIMKAALVSAAWLAGAGLVCLILAKFCRRRAPAAAAAPA